VLVTIVLRRVWGRLGLTAVADAACVFGWVSACSGIVDVVFTWWAKENASLEVHKAGSFAVHGDFGVEVYVWVLDHVDVLKGAVPHEAAEPCRISEDVAYYSCWN
jgi:hypothetical protein